jgi:hypothetical protein
LTFVKIAQARGLQGCEMHEDIGAAIVWQNKTELLV